MQSFNTMLLSRKHCAKSLSDAGFYHTRKHFLHKIVLVKGVTEFQTNLKIWFFFTENKDLILCFHFSVTLTDWQEIQSPSQQHKRLSPTCIYVYVKGKQFGLENFETLPVYSLSTLSVAC